MAVRFKLKTVIHLLINDLFIDCFNGFIIMLSSFATDRTIEGCYTL